MTDSLRPYPEYKDSGVDWLDDIPAHWSFTMIRRYCRVFAGATPSRAVPEYWMPGTIPWLSSGDVNLRRITIARQFISEAGFRASSTKWIRPQSLVMALAGQGKTKGLVATVEIAATCNQSLGVIEPNLKVADYRYVAYFLDSKYKEIRGLVGDGLRDGLNLEIVKSMYTPLPPPDEQAAIVTFLDAAETRIRRYIRAKQKLIKLLNEQKQAIIQQAVTRGLNPDVPMKDSGVEWLGAIPAHWDEPIKMKFISSLKGRLGWQGLKANEYTDVGPYVVSSAHFKNHRIKWDICPHVTIERYEMDANIQLAVGDILLMKDGAAMGKLAFIDYLPDLACLNSHLLLFRPLEGEYSMTYYPQYMFYFMLTAPFQNYVKVNGTGTTFLGISQSSLGNFSISLPPIEEQEEIVEVLDVETALLNRAISVTEQQIEQAGDYRTRLIADVVTGKVDVRGLTFEMPEAFDDDELLDVDEDELLEEDGLEEIEE